MDNNFDQLTAVIDTMSDEEKKLLAQRIKQLDISKKRYVHKTNGKPYRKSSIRNHGRNDPCFCGSGKKYKRCCL